MKLKTLLTTALLIAVTAGTAKEYRRTGNAVSFRKARIEVLSPTMFSVREGDNYRFAPVRTDLGVTELPTAPVAFDITKEGAAYRIATGEITIVYDPEQPLTAGGIRVEGKASVPELGAEDRQNLGGVVGALDNCDGEKCYSEQNDITSSHDIRPTPQDGILSRRGYTVLKHTQDQLNLFREGQPYEELYVLCYGKDYRRAFTDFFSIAGDIPMFPKWSLGLIYSRWRDYTDEDYKQIVNGFRKERIPLDAVILDMC